LFVGLELLTCASSVGATVSVRGAALTGPTPADNHKVLNNTHAFVASWRAKPAPFTSWAKFVAQQYRDFQGRAPTGGESSAAVTSLNTGVQTPPYLREEGPC